MDVIFRSPPEVLMMSSSNFVFFTTGPTGVAPPPRPRLAPDVISLSAPIYVRGIPGGNVGGGYSVGPAFPWVRVYFSSSGVSLQRSDMNPLTSRSWASPYVNGFVKYTGSSIVTFTVNVSGLVFWNRSTICIWSLCCRPAEFSQESRARQWYPQRGYRRPNGPPNVRSTPDK